MKTFSASLPLRGKRILVTRPMGQSEPLVALIQAQGAEASCFPLIDIAPPQSWHALDDASARLEAFHMAIFISPNAVAFGLGRILSRRLWPEGLAAAAVGPGTGKMLSEARIGTVIVPEGTYDSETLLSLPAFRAEQMKNQSILILRGDGGRELLPESLRTRGARVECVACYQRILPHDGSQIVSLLRNNALDAITLSSSEGLRKLLQLLDTGDCEKLLALPVFVPHRRIASEAARLGLRHVVLTEASDSGLVLGLCSYRWSNHE